MTDPSQQCPSVWQEITTPHRVCGRRSSSGGCEGLNYTTGSEQYDQVCGRIVGYQLGIPNAFDATGRSIDTDYVNGISVTHSSPRQHIWTFAAGVDEQIRGHTRPCIIGNTAARRPPSFVGQNYFYETGITSGFGGDGVLYPNGDPLWDGVVLVAPVVPSTHHHGSIYDYLLPQLMTLRSGSVIMLGFKLPILQYNSWNSM